MTKALKKFRTDKGAFPVAGTVPDMAGYTKIYLKIQAAYKAKSAEDRQVMFEYLKEIPTTKPITEKTLEVFIKNWNSLVRIQYK